MTLQEQINSLSLQIARLSSFNLSEIDTEKIQRTDEATQIQANVDYVKIMTGVDSL